ncbi:DUF4350 domain-containing protein [Antarcticibacterium flavum]|uniref:DUF4350 domain-containing protein n=1 Tax=Antarcticibacterium flavum TaxID=2058175 RepID=A0A5B7X716_9FLAO|nr:DUF4350 domain-containing protein [Antarcticibacterium flavum]
MGKFYFLRILGDTGVNLEKVDVPPFEFLNSEPGGTYFFLNNYLDFDKAEVKKILNWVEEGNTVFLAASYFSESLRDTLQLETSTLIPGGNFTSRPYVSLVNKKLQQSNAWHFDHDVNLEYFSRIDTLKHTILGVGSLKEYRSQEEAYPLFLHSEWGKGNIYIHSFPEAFSNYFLLKEDNYKYAEGVLAYLDNKGPVYWDRYYKTGKKFHTSPLYILLNNRALKWAYYFILIGAVLFIIFEGKRKQRPVPVVEPLKNQTYEYSRTIADLYLEQKQYKALALKKIDHFYDYIRTRYRIFSAWQEEKTLRELSQKSGHSIEDINDLRALFTDISRKPEISKEELRELNEKIDSYKQ